LKKNDPEDNQPVLKQSSIKVEQELYKKEDDKVLSSGHNLKAESEVKDNKNIF
jgi:hypothetical protein